MTNDVFLSKLEMGEKVETFINHEAVFQSPINQPQPGKQIFWTIENESNISSLLWEKPIKISKGWGEQEDGGRG